MNIQKIKEELLFQALYGKEKKVEKVEKVENFESAINAEINKIFEAQSRGVQNG